MRMSRNRVIGAALLAFALIAAACGDSGDDVVTEGPDIVIGSFGFGESEILGEIYKQALEAEGYTVTHNPQIGPREIVAPATGRAWQVAGRPRLIGTRCGVNSTWAASSSSISGVWRCVRNP